MSQAQPDQNLEEIERALYEGRKIEAIKLYRENMGGGLKEAKDAVDDLEKELRAHSPEKFKSPPCGRGCVGVLLLVGLVIICVYIAL